MDNDGDAECVSASTSLGATWRGRLTRTRPYVLPGLVRRGVLGGVLCAAVLLGGIGVKRVVAPPFRPQCGPLDRWDRQVVVATAPRRISDAEFARRLRSVEGNASLSRGRRSAAHEVRLQCGFVSDRSEIVEASGLQWAAKKIPIDEQYGPRLLAAAVKARDSKVPLDQFERSGRFDAVRMLEWAVAQPESNPPSEFDGGRMLMSIVLFRANDGEP